ncbi:F-box and leucine-rich repeat protein 13-like [Saccostrea cucullata]|uniref:F-box and leucine-rich repeat protein 13-like n=1 Tax=Saccostrea cuccullata TaxID=36930 RepID=UPI002ED3FD86
MKSRGRGIRNTIRMGTDKKTVTSEMEEKKLEKDDRLSKRLCYILRYGALKEGLKLYHGDFVELDQLLELELMRHNSKEEVIHEVDISLSHRNAKRFERKEENGKIYVRACFCRNFEENPCHEGSRVPRLTESCVQYICTNLNDYDLEDFPDEHLVSKMIQKMKKQSKLNSAALRQLLVPVLEHLDLSGVYVTESTLRLVWRNCPNLRVLSLKDCGYLMTDSVMEQLVKKLPHLESLSLCACKHLTDRAAKALCKHAKNLRELNLSWISTISEAAIIDLMTNCPQLMFLDIYDHNISKDGRSIIADIARQRKMKIVLKGLTDLEIAPENPCSLLPNFGKVW